MSLTVSVLRLSSADEHFQPRRLSSDWSNEQDLAGRRLFSAAHAPDHHRMPVGSFAMHHFVEIGAEWIVPEMPTTNGASGTGEGRCRPLHEA